MSDTKKSATKKPTRQESVLQHAKRVVASAHGNAEALALSILANHHPRMVAKREVLMRNILNQTEEAFYLLAELEHGKDLFGNGPVPDVPGPKEP
jgi:hypothetical protein